MKETLSNEDRFRVRFAEMLEVARQEKDWTLREMADAMDTSISQVKRLLLRRDGGSLTLRTVFRAAAALGVQIDISLIFENDNA